jgi:hypothetical protein
MSHTGLYSGLYARVRHYAELLDEVIIRLKSGTSTPADLGRQKLARLLLTFDEAQPADLSSQLLSVLVRDQEGDRPGRWSEVGTALLAPGIDPAVIDRLEQLARAIEHERAGMFSKMRGRGS